MSDNALGDGLEKDGGLRSSPGEDRISEDSQGDEDLITIRNYMIEHENLMVGQINDLVERFKKHPEVMVECARFIRDGKFLEENIAFSINNYTAEKIKDLAHTNGFWAYTFLLTLLDKPKMAQEIIDSGFVIR